MGLAGTLMNTLALTSLTHVFCGDCTTATAQLDELAGLAEKKGSLYWKAFATWLQGWLLALIGNATEAVGILTSGVAAWRSTGATLFAPMQLSYLASTYAKLGQFDDARRSLNEATTAMEASKEMWFEAEANRLAGEVALIFTRNHDAAKAQAYFERALGCRTSTTSQILGTPRLHEPRASLARPGQAAASARTACSGLRLVH